MTARITVARAPTYEGAEVAAGRVAATGGQNVRIESQSDGMYAVTTDDPNAPPPGTIPHVARQLANDERAAFEVKQKAWEEERRLKREVASRLGSTDHRSSVGL